MCIAICPQNKDYETDAVFRLLENGINALHKLSLVIWNYYVLTVTGLVFYFMIATMSWVLLTTNHFYEVLSQQYYFDVLNCKFISRTWTI